MLPETENRKLDPLKVLQLPNGATKLFILDIAAITAVDWGRRTHNTFYDNLIDVSLPRIKESQQDGARTVYRRQKGSCSLSLVNFTISTSTICKVFKNTAGETHMINACPTI